MKRKAHIFLALTVVPLSLLVSACRAEAEEAQPAAETPSEAAAPASTDESQAPDIEAGDTNIVINQEITVLKELPPTAPPDLDLSEGVEAIVKLAQSGVS